MLQLTTANLPSLTRPLVPSSATRISATLRSLQLQEASTTICTRLRLSPSISMISTPWWPLSAQMTSPMSVLPSQDPMVQDRPKRTQERSTQRLCVSSTRATCCQFKLAHSTTSRRVIPPSSCLPEPTFSRSRERPLLLPT